mgnify:CR=1 FL=1
MAGISEAITQIKKAESDADSLVEQSTVDAKAMIDEATVKANEMIELAKNEASEEAQSTVFNAEENAKKEAESITSQAEKDVEDIQKAMYDKAKDFLDTHITSADINKVGILLELLSLLEPTKLMYVTQIDMTDRTDMKLLYDDRIEIQIGSSYDLEYKLGYVRQIITDKLANNWEGTIIYYSATAGASAIKKGDELVTPIKPEDMQDDGEDSSDDEDSEND